MISPRKIPQAVRDAQIRAADPETSVFVSANAGSGKTHVLTQRVINLLLQGVDPSKILCITYNKAAAANMANRVFERLAEWIALDDAAFDRHLSESAGKPVTVAQRVLAREHGHERLEIELLVDAQQGHAQRQCSPRRLQLVCVRPKALRAPPCAVALVGRAEVAEHGEPTGEGRVADAG